MDVTPSSRDIAELRAMLVEEEDGGSDRSLNDLACVAVQFSALWLSRPRTRSHARNRCSFSIQRSYRRRTILRRLAVNRPDTLHVDDRST